MGGCGHIPHNLIGGFIHLQKLNLVRILKPEIKFEALGYKFSEEMYTVQVLTQCIEGFEPLKTWWG